MRKAGQGLQEPLQQAPSCGRVGRKDQQRMMLMCHHQPSRRRPEPWRLAPTWGLGGVLKAVTRKAQSPGAPCWASRGVTSSLLPTPAAAAQAVAEATAAAAKEPVSGCSKCSSVAGSQDGSAAGSAMCQRRHSSRSYTLLSPISARLSPSSRKSMTPPRRCTANDSRQNGAIN